MSHELMPGRSLAGNAVNVGVGILEDGGIVVLNHAPEGVAILTVEEASDYLGLLRSALIKSANPRRRQ